MQTKFIIKFIRLLSKVQYFLFIGPAGKVNDTFLFLAAYFAFIPVMSHGNYISLVGIIAILYCIRLCVYS